MFKKILIANRGEIAVRIIRACNDLNIESVAIYSRADRDSMHVKMADETHEISEDPIKGYLDPDRIIEVAKLSGAEAIHPGYGFLSENALFAKKVAEAGLVWIGPNSEVIAKMGDKNAAREIMQRHGIPVVPGTEPLNKESMESIKRHARRIGYPVILKASSGGGGRGIRVVQKEEELEDSFNACKREAMAFFKNDDVFMEKYVQNPKHIEFQILADNYGNVIHLMERDCSIQRRHQKLVEIAPSPTMSEDLRRRMGAVAVAAAKATGYSNAGTVEFLVDDYNNFYFMEMNTRIQVEHGVTEEITGLDLIGRQIRIASGEILDMNQNDVLCQGFAIEVRINAEDVKNDFVPSPGKITSYYPALGPFVRVDSCIYKDYTIPPYYDSMVAKLIVRATSYDLAVNKMKRALGEFTVRGIKTTIPFLINICKDRDFRKGNFDTSYLEKKMGELMPKDIEEPADIAAVIAAAIAARAGL
ncbi:acetyl-CoA carboxylase subunit A [Wolinella succinogenes]|uniref:PUTATIVE PYRUVATE CARBOXYLASE A SUBUNIT n=1 Tax=Wolinella succinogenes (strain ATCC 29543 / DSM 1740 / CCUG 13145 / JCM 31913 / LMG 7466 / NCTC 11488 / FDC 602W) TaxID=273121 RepID=Q7M900_WOLSU|nr:acetyl-CoA carboxylase subunit A [Wolinella succinogenes]NLU34468.1 acetyl-CoA carboxylase subunit A [Wolinella succinogenes]CAE10367.1 PUTATIVE PYRUVATE CARBOXYLASE A SUBUNIT [Wolinella succinogenes]VEG80426.1 2-oxoglutarate carboxylase small subunit [Wolinella succinogenes]HCZ19789.1 acetyl-CoA carboxylase biotin carboxylase subunit [Helicobacter sp.]